MEEYATQPCKDPFFIPSTYPPPPKTPAFVFSSITDDPDYEATQPTDEAIRLANRNSGLTDEDASDIVCILHPDSDLAREACAEINKLHPKNTISLEGGNSYLTAEGQVPCDLALRLSANLKDENLGWIFGRSEERCDFMIRDGTPPQISNQHFRIYLNEHGFLMVEDMSTNGISVDGTILRLKKKNNGKPYRQTIENGTIISLALNKPVALSINFVVRIPRRSDEAQEAFETNFAIHVRRIQERQIRRRVAGGVERQPLNLFPNAANRGSAESSSIFRKREWRGGSKYNKLDMIGKGAFAVVYRVTDKRTGVPFAAKELDKKKFLKNGAKNIDSEIKIMSKIHHDNVVSFVECIDWDDYLYIIMEFVPEGDLTSLVTMCHFLPEHAVKGMTIQLLSALKYLHSINVTHRDIKPDNILCQSRNPLHVKLTDFGLSKMIDTEDTFLHTFCGTLLYCAPEVYNEYPQYDRTGRRTNRRSDDSTTQQRYDHAVDVWSLAGVLFYSFCGTPPFPVGAASHHTQILQRIMTVPLDVRPLQRCGVSPNAIRFVIKMLHTDPEHRATIEDLEQSPWLTGNDPDLDETEDEDVGQLEVPASQLSLLDASENNGENDEFGEETIQFQPREMPASFSTNESDDERSLELASSIPSDFGKGTELTTADQIEGDESYEFIRNPANVGRLFGEVNVNSSALGSSGAVPVDLPTPIQHIGNNKHQQVSKQDDTLPVAKFRSRLEAASAMPKTPLPPPPATHPRFVTPAAKHFENGVAPNHSSLLGAVSQLGHLQMNSPLISPTDIITPHLSTLSHAQAANISLRRPREVGGWQPELPPQKRRKSARTIDVMVPPETFWNPRDKSTHHEHYPPMSAADWNRYVELAKSKGEKFQHGCTIFENVMVSFRSNSKTPSIGSNLSFRAQSEPLVEGKKRYIPLARDERRLSDDASVQQSIASRENLSITTDALVPEVAQNSEPSSPVKLDATNDNEIISSIEAATEGTSAIIPKIDASAGDNFQVPKRVLAKFSATPDSCLPTIAFNITEAFTSWGRGFSNTIRYATREDVRIGVPRYAFKLILFKNDFYHPGEKYTEVWNKSHSEEEEQGFRFLISTKSSAGLKINGHKLPSHNISETSGDSKFWGEIRNGDIITISTTKNMFLKLKFDCFWGMGKYNRHESKFFLYKEEDHIAKVDRVCTMLETAFIEERTKKLIEEQKLAKELKRQRTQSVDI
ncbi:uncharacterized protein EAE97_006114 [Botrytis byssoidea]|uniref:non-specific serine/threonine protein kinase n=1 Tax=Botrytis byssoidea TaxID=139641 RepID=A0A9P5IIK1_9HELO|nr:uncharacterized protein EAE97_006114 [Botrytis byssoidea]KAF7942660.1 hypothetical protein EAE97_006114 [Botrytis byssoidea]